MDKEFIKSMNLGFAAVDELTELSEEDWNALGGRLRLPGIPIRQLIAATNPGSPQHWVYSRGVLNPPKDDNGNTRVEFIKSRTLDNYYLPAEYIDNLKRTLFGFYFERYVMGEWVGSDDIVYDNFNRNTHIIKDFTIPKNWKRFRAVDFGYRAPFFCGWFAVAEEDGEGKRSTVDGKEQKFEYFKGDIFLYREIYYTQRTASVNAQRVLELSKYPDNSPEQIIRTVADWDSGDRADLESKGIYTIAANKDIGVGIQKVRERLGNVDPSKGLVVRTRFFIFENSIVEIDPKIRLNLENGGQNNNPVRAAEEFLVYSWKPNKEEPIDDFNHGLDGIRYFIMAYDGIQMWADIPFLKV
jgi:phage terminase large subunit